MLRNYNRLKLFVFALVILLSGCRSYEDINKKSIIITAGVDRVEDKLEISSETAKQASEEGTQGEQVSETNVYTTVAYGKTFEEARSDSESQQPFPTFLGATRVVIFGETYAKEGINPYINRVNKIYDYRKTVLAVVSRDCPSELFKTNVSDISVGFFIEDNINFLADNGQTLYTNVGDILSSIALGEVGYLLPYIGKDEGIIKYLGLAVMKDSKFISVIDRNQTKSILYLVGKRPNLTEVVSPFKTSQNKISFRVLLDNRNIKTKYEDGNPTISINLNLNAELRYQYYNSKLSSDDIPMLELLLSEQIKKEISNMITRSQKEFRCDIFDFAKYFRIDHPKVYEKIKWSEIYPHATIELDVKVRLVNQNLFDYK